MLGIWPLSLCLGLLCCYNVPGRERQTLNTALLLRSRNPHLNREQGTVHSWVTPRSSQGSLFTPVSSSSTITAPALKGHWWDVLQGSWCPKIPQEPLTLL